MSARLEEPLKKGHHPEVTVRLDANFPRYLALLVAIASLAKTAPEASNSGLPGALVSTPPMLMPQRDKIGRYASEAARLEGTASLGALFVGGLDALKAATQRP